MRAIYPSGSAAGSNKFVVNPTNGGAQPALCARAPDRTHAFGALQFDERALHRALAGIQGQRERRGGPGRAVGEQRQQRRLLAIDGRHQHDDRALAKRREHEAARGGVNLRQRRNERAQTADLDAQPRPVRLVGAARAERARDQRVPIDVARATPRRARVPT